MSGEITNDGLSLSQVKGKGNLRHNNREYPPGCMPGNIAIDRTPLNVCAVEYRLTLDEVYKKLFPVEDYNAKQKRSDRRMTSYFENEFGIPASSNKAKYSPVENPKTRKKSFYEDVVQIGDMLNCGIIYEHYTDSKGRKRIKYDSDGKAVIKSIAPNYDKAVEALKIYMFGDEKLGIPSYQKRNPNFIIFDGWLNLDEATPHWHIDYIPIGTKYKKGLPIQTSYSKALSEMGYYGSDAFEQWRKKERQILRECGEAVGLKIRPADDEQPGHKHLTVRSFKEEAAQAEENLIKVEAESESLRLQNETLTSINTVLLAENDYLDERIETLKSEYKKQKELKLTKEELEIIMRKRAYNSSKKPFDAAAIVEKSMQSYDASKRSQLEPDKTDTANPIQSSESSKPLEVTAIKEPIASPQPPTPNKPVDKKTVGMTPEELAESTVENIRERMLKPNVILDSLNKSNLKINSVQQKNPNGTNRQPNN